MKIFFRTSLRKILWPVLLAGLLMLTGCGPGKKVDRGPAEILSEYMDAIINGRVEEAYQHLSSRDRNEKTLNVYRAERADEESLIRNMIAKKINYSIRDIRMAGDEAKVRVDITAPDYDRMIRDILSEPAARNIPPGSLNAHVHVSGLLGKYVRKYREQGIPMKKTTEFFDMVREAGEWKVSIHNNGKR